MENKFTFHVLGIPNAPTNDTYNTANAFSMKVYKFCKMMTARGHRVLHYGIEGSNVPCTENIIVVPKDVFAKDYGKLIYDSDNNFFKENFNDFTHKLFTENCITEIEKRRSSKDFLLAFWGIGTNAVNNYFKDKMIVIEPGIGYGCALVDTPYHIYESYAIRNSYWGISKVFGEDMNQYDVVIPCYFDLDNFTPNYNSRIYKNSEPYFLFVGRICDGKGVQVAISVCETLGIKLKVAGYLASEYINYKWPKEVEYIGPVNIEQRNELMRNAIASFVPSQYSEPFGWVVIENNLCGTPVITSDFGAFPENVIEGKTGYICRTFNDYVSAALNCLEGKISFEDCRKHGEKYSLENIAPYFEKYFKDVLNIYTRDGWYSLDKNTVDRIKYYKD